MTNFCRAPLGALLLAACKSAPAPTSPTTLSDWLEEQERTTLGRTPAVEGDDDEQLDVMAALELPTEAEGGRTIDLREVLELVVSQGLDVEMARERYIEAQAEQSIAEAAWWPSLSLGTTLYRNQGRVQDTRGVLLDVDKRNAWAGGGVRVDLDLGEAIYGTRAARHRTSASLAQRRGATQDAASLAAMTYFDLVESHARLPIAEDALARARELVALAETRLRDGAGLETDVARARVHEADIQRAAIEARVGALRASSVLVELLQLSADESLTPDENGLGELHLVDPTFSTQHGQPTDLALQAAYRSHPELRAANALVEASDAEREQAARGWLLPSVVLGAQFGALGYNYADLESQDVYTAALQWDLGAELFGNSDRMNSRRRWCNATARSSATCAPWDWSVLDSTIASSHCAHEKRAPRDSPRRSLFPCRMLPLAQEGTAGPYAPKTSCKASLRLKPAGGSTGSRYQNWKFQVEPGTMIPAC